MSCNRPIVIERRLEELFHRKLVDYLKAINDRINVMLNLKYHSKEVELVRVIKQFQI